MQILGFTQMDEGNTSDCSVSLEEKTYLSLSAAAEDHDKSLQGMVFP